MKEKWSEDSLLADLFIGNSVDWLDRNICLRIKIPRVLSTLLLICFLSMQSMLRETVLYQKIFLPMIYEEFKIFWQVSSFETASGLKLN